MADFCDDQEIVTEFLLNTCRLRHGIDFDHGFILPNCAMIVGLASFNKPGLIPVITGSVAEFYIEPMLSCVGDQDIMCHCSAQLAIPAIRPHSYQTSLTALLRCLKLSTASFQATCT